MPEERQVAGLWCSQVLARLSEHVDQELPPETTAQIEAHLAECDWCLNFGVQFSAVVQELTRQLSTPEPLSASVAQRLHERLRQGMGR